jgi:DNA-binding response OmpR family regulator
MSEKKILVVEDEPELSEVFRLILIEENYQLIFASDGQTALELASTHRPDLILLDIKMPLMDGWAFLEEYSKTDQVQSPVLVVSAGTSNHTRQRAAEFKVAGIIDKPFQLDDFLGQIYTQLFPSPPNQLF